MPLVSVIIPTHNRPDMLAEALASVRAQTLTDYEIIVVSNGETDEMRECSRALARACGSVYAILANGNVSVARNRGIKLADGEWIAFLDDDDLWLPHKLERQVAAAERSGADMIACDYVMFYPDGAETLERIRPPEGWTYLKASSHLSWWCVPSCVMVRKRVFNEIGGFHRHMRYSEDNEMWQRILRRHTIHQIDEPLVRYRSGHQSMMEQLKKNKRKSTFYELMFFTTIYCGTPSDLRWALPSMKIFVSPRLNAVLPDWFNPDWFNRPHPWLRPRTRLNQLRLWLRTRFMEMRYRLRLRTRMRALVARLRIL